VGIERVVDPILGLDPRLVFFDRKAENRFGYES
jgi:hypothetical protein